MPVPASGILGQTRCVAITITITKEMKAICSFWTVIMRFLCFSKWNETADFPGRDGQHYRGGRDGQSFATLGWGRKDTRGAGPEMAVWWRWGQRGALHEALGESQTKPRHTTKCTVEEHSRYAVPTSCLRWQWGFFSFSLFCLCPSTLYCSIVYKSVLWKIHVLLKKWGVRGGWDT